MGIIRKKLKVVSVGMCLGLAISCFGNTETLACKSKSKRTVKVSRKVRRSKNKWKGRANRSKRRLKRSRRKLRRVRRRSRNKVKTTNINNNCNVGNNGVPSTNINNNYNVNENCNVNRNMMPPTNINRNINHNINKTYNENIVRENMQINDGYEMIDDDPNTINNNQPIVNVKTVVKGNKKVQNIVSEGDQDIQQDQQGQQNPGKIY